MNDLDWNDYFDNDRECGGDDYQDAAYTGDLDDDLEDDEV